MQTKDIISGIQSGAEKIINSVVPEKYRGTGNKILSSVGNFAKSLVGSQEKPIDMKGGAETPTSMSDADDVGTTNRISGWDKFKNFFVPTANAALSYGQELGGKFVGDETAGKIKNVITGGQKGAYTVYDQSWRDKKNPNIQRDQKDGGQYSRLWSAYYNHDSFFPDLKSDWAYWWIANGKAPAAPAKIRKWAGVE